ncbi:MAG: hypothetical protein CML29_08130 [Rhizobiales bacterium]|nr:hypothetical protein [Hyphomicrobiales bacterium]MBA67519.1 hypothetical protein [Hyphomicrobiales bacterium]|tara:strand:- start:608 stop:1138 length:531 start_codon:yes stop_codon:yes gene_type:complete
MANILNLLGPVLFGIAIVGVLLFAKRVLRVPLPRWALPVGAALGILGAHIYNEYTWFDRFTGELPEGVEVIQSGQSSSILEPWTYLVPKTTRFAALDRNSIRTNPAQPGMKIGEVLLFQRHTPTARLLQVADCEGGRIAALSADTAFDENGLPEGVQWAEVKADEPLFSSICQLEG